MPGFQWQTRASDLPADDERRHEKYAKSVLSRVIHVQAYAPKRKPQNTRLSRL